MRSFIYPSKKEYKSAFAVISVIVLLSLFISGTIISISNDLFAFSRRDAYAELEISESYTLPRFSRLLQKKGIIDNPAFFCLYVTIKGKTELVEEYVGTLHLDSTMSYGDILNCFSK